MSADVCTDVSGRVHTIEAPANPSADGVTPKPWHILVDNVPLPTPDWLLFPRGVAGASSVAVFGNGHGGNDAHAWLVSTLGHKMALDPAHGAQPGAMERRPDGSFRLVYVLKGATYYREIVFREDFSVTVDAIVPLPPEQVGTSQGILYLDGDIHWTGDPRFPESSTDNMVQMGGATLRLVSPAGPYWIGQHQYSDQVTVFDEATQKLQTVFRGHTNAPAKIALGASGAVAAISAEHYRSYFVPQAQWEARFRVELPTLPRPVYTGAIYRLTDRADWGGDDPDQPGTFDVLFELGTIRRADRPFYGGLQALFEADAWDHPLLLGAFCAPHPADINQLEREIYEAHGLRLRVLAYHDGWPLVRVPTNLVKGDALAVQCYAEPTEPLNRFYARVVEYAHQVSRQLPDGVSLALMWQAYDRNGTQTERRRLEALQYQAYDALRELPKATHLVEFNDRSKGGIRQYLGEMRPVHEAITAASPGVPSLPPFSPDPPKPTSPIPRARSLS